MAIKGVAYSVALLLLLVNHGVQGTQLSEEEEELDLDKQYKQLQKPSIKTIKTKYGSIYDCVDFYKQPAFDHPLMKNHTFHYEMRPNYGHGHIEATSSNEEIVECHIKKLTDGGCPTGTVPIKRVSKNEFHQMKSFTKNLSLFRKSNSIQPQLGQHFAIVQTNSDPSTMKYYGARGIFNVYHLSMGASQYSSGEMIFQNENDMIKVGWMVNPTINKDSKVHLFQYLSAGQSHCFNTLCLGFVNTNKDLSIDAEIDGASTRGWRQRSLSVSVYQDVDTKDWWLSVCGITIGFWPHQIFTAMADASTYVAVGGEAYGPPDQPLPPMGNGYYPSENLSLSAYCLNFTVLDANRHHINPQQTELYAPDWHYGVNDMGLYRKFGRTICYGGTTL